MLCVYSGEPSRVQGFSVYDSIFGVSLNGEDMAHALYLGWHHLSKEYWHGWGYKEHCSALMVLKNYIPTVLNAFD